MPISISLRQCFPVLLWPPPDPHPDTRRLDLIDRHKLDLVVTPDGLWAATDLDGTAWADDQPDVRAAIDAAEKAIAERKEKSCRP